MVLSGCSLASSRATSSRRRHLLSSANSKPLSPLWLRGWVLSRLGNGSGGRDGCAKRRPARIGARGVATAARRADAPRPARSSICASARQRVARIERNERFLQQHCARWHQENERILQRNSLATLCTRNKTTYFCGATCVGVVARCGATTMRGCGRYVTVTQNNLTWRRRTSGDGHVRLVGDLKLTSSLACKGGDRLGRLEGGGPRGPCNRYDFFFVRFAARPGGR